jgi:hypothetical protein
MTEAIGPVAGRVGRPRRRPDAILADGGYDSAAFREWLRSKAFPAYALSQVAQVGMALSIMAIAFTDSLSV